VTAFLKAPAGASLATTNWTDVAGDVLAGGSVASKTVSSTPTAASF